MASNPSLHPQVNDVPFQEGDMFTPTLAYMAFHAPFFDDLPQFLGHRDRLKDDELSNAPTAVKARLAALEGGLRFSNPSGRTVAWAQGTVLNSSGELVAVTAGSATAPANATTYYWYQEGVGVQSGATPPNLKAILAKVVTNATNVTSIDDLRNPASIQIAPTASTIRCLGGQATTDKTCTQGETFGAGLYYFRDFIVPAGVTVTFTCQTTINCSGRFRVEGSIVMAAAIPGSPAIPLVLSPLGSSGGSPGSGLGGGGIAYGYGSQPYGSGGSSGIAFTNASSSWCGLAPGGNGAVGLVVNAAGTVEVISGGSIIAKGGNALSSAVQNSANPNPCVVSGSGGGSGGVIWLSSRLSVTVAGTLDTSGGNGGAGYRSTGMPATWAALGGNPGSAGVVVLQAPTVNTTGWTLLNTMGSHGAHAGLNGSNQISNGGAIIAGGNGAGFSTASGGVSLSGTTTITVTNLVLGNGLVYILNTIPVG